MTQSAFVVLATLFAVSGFSLSVSASTIPRLPRFRTARRQVWLLALASLALCGVLIATVVRA